MGQKELDEFRAAVASERRSAGTRVATEEEQARALVLRKRNVARWKLRHPPIHVIEPPRPYADVVADDSADGD